MLQIQMHVIDLAQMYHGSELMCCQHLQAQARLRDGLVSEIEDLNERKGAVAASVADMTAQITGLTEDLGGGGDAASAQVSTLVS